MDTSVGWTHYILGFAVFYHTPTEVMLCGIMRGLSTMYSQNYYIDSTNWRLIKMPIPRNIGTGITSNEGFVFSNANTKTIPPPNGYASQCRIRKIYLNHSEVFRPIYNQYGG